MKYLCSVSLRRASLATLTLSLAAMGAGCAGSDSSNVTLTALTDGDGTGMVTMSPPGGTYAPGTTVTLTATAATGEFVGWLGGGCTGHSTCEIILGSDATITAVFGTRTFVGTRPIISLSGFTDTQSINGVSVDCPYLGSVFPSDVTFHVATLGNGTLAGYAETSIFISMNSYGAPVCEPTRDENVDLVGSVSGTPPSFAVSLTGGGFIAPSTLSLTGTIDNGTGGTGGSLSLSGTFMAEVVRHPTNGTVDAFTAAQQ